MKIIALSGSVSFYKEFEKIENILKALGYNVVMSDGVYEMRKSNNFDVGSNKPWLKTNKGYDKKGNYMRSTMEKISKADALLVVNLTKNNIKGYIGGTMLINMGLAFYLKIPIFLYNELPDDISFKEEILGMKPILINGNLKHLSV